jgi:hypothetical protein
MNAESWLQRDSIQWQDGKSALMLSSMKDHRQPANRSKSYAKITSVRTSFRFYANGPRALGKTQKHADVSKGDRLAGTKRKSALNLEVLSRSFAPIRDFLVFDDLPFIETAEAGSFHRGDVDEHIFAAATLRLNKPIALGRIEPLHGAFSHYLLQATCVAPRS